MRSSWIILNPMASILKETHRGEARYEDGDKAGKYGTQSKAPKGIRSRARQGQGEVLPSLDVRLLASGSVSFMPPVAIICYSSHTYPAKVKNCV